MEGMGHSHQVRGQQPPYDNAGQPPQRSRGNDGSGQRWYQPTLESKITVALVAIAAVIVFLALMTSVFTQSGVGRYVKSDQYQAVFLTNGQVYFGQITSINNGTLVLEDIYYLQVDQQLQPDQAEGSVEPQVSLAKLGNELHGPEDQMFISMREVIFWENLKDEGEVVQAIRTFRENGGAQETEGQEASDQTDASSDDDE